MTELILGFILGVLFAATTSFMRFELRERRARRAADLEAYVQAEVERRYNEPWNDEGWMGPEPNGSRKFQPIRHP